MSILIRNVDAVTLDAAGTVLTNTDILVANGRIQAIGPGCGFDPADEVLDGTGHVALPAFFNAHCHAAMTFERGWAEDLPLDRWFNERIWVAESALTADDVYWGASLAACEMIRSGCIGFNDHYFHMDRVAEVVDQSGMKACLTWCQFGIGADKEVGTDLAGALAFAERWQGGANGRLRTVLGPHSPYVCPPEFLREIAALAKSRGLGLHIHLAESQAQVDNSRKAFGKTPTAHLEALGAFDVPAVVAHALYLTDEDVAILDRHGVSVAHCPVTYMKLAMGVNDLSRLLAAGVNVALGTDGPGSSNDLDMKNVVRLTPLLQKFARNDAEALPGDLPLRMATYHGAQAMGFPESGRLIPGLAADLILMDTRKPHFWPRHDLIANIVHAARAGDVRHVIADGRLLMRDGVLLTLDEKKIMAEAHERARRMVSGTMSIVREYKG